MENQVIVQVSCKAIRALALDALRGKWGLATLATLVWSIALTIPTWILSIAFESETTIVGISDIYLLLVDGAFTLGYAIFCLSIFRQQRASVAQVFYGFERFAKTLGLYLVMNIFIFLWACLLIIPGIIATYRYSLCFYILADHPEMGILEALRESSRLMKGNKLKMFLLELSITGWWLACIFVLCMAIFFSSTNMVTMMGFYLVILISLLALLIVLLWILPYIEVARIALYDLARGSLRADGPPAIEEEPKRF